MFIPDLQAMQALAEKFALNAPAALCVYLQGDLGTGKTTLVRNILRILGHEGSVKSPTYTLVEPYVIGSRRIYHFDLYRLSEPEELEAMGIRDYLDDEALVFIEWPEMGQGVLKDADLTISLKHLKQGRDVEILPSSEKGQTLQQKLIL